MAFVELTVAGEEPNRRVWLKAEEVDSILEGERTTASTSSGFSVQVRETADEVVAQMRKQMWDQPFQFVYCACGQVIPRVESDTGQVRCIGCR